MRSLVRTRRIRRLEERYLSPEEKREELLGYYFGDIEEGTAYGSDFFDGEGRPGVFRWSQGCEATRPADIPPPPPQYWDAIAREELELVRLMERAGLLGGEDEETRGKGRRARKEQESARESDAVLQDHRAKFEMPTKGTPWDERHELATAPRKRRPGLRYTDGGERWPA